MCTAISEDSNVDGIAIDNNTKSTDNDTSDTVSGSDAMYSPSTYKGCKLTLNHAKNSLTIQYNDSSASNSDSTSNIDQNFKFHIHIWDIQGLDIDYMEHVGQNDTGNEAGTEEDTKILKLDTYSPIKCVEIDHSTGNYDVYGGNSHGNVMFTKLDAALRHIVITTQAPISISTTSTSTSTTSNTNDEDDDELLDSILYGLPLLIQQFKKTINQRYHKIEKNIINPKIKLFQIYHKQQDNEINEFINQWEEKEWKRLHELTKKRTSLVVNEQTLLDAEALLLTFDERTSGISSSNNSQTNLNNLNDKMNNNNEVEIEVRSVDKPKIHINLILLKKHFMKWQNNM